MRTSIKLILLFACMGCGPAFASHIVGGGFTYRYMGDTTIMGQPRQIYRVTLDIYQDCLTGVPDAIAQDNPAFFTVYEVGTTTPFSVDTNVYYDATPGSGGAISIPPAEIATPCGTVPADVVGAHCLLRKRFVRTYYLPASSVGYIVVNQRCCRNSSIVNVLNPGDEGITFYCTIPASTIHNSSAAFTEYPPATICLNQYTTFNQAAIDADGDSLTYELTTAYAGASGLDIKPKVSDPPPYTPMGYFPPYTAQAPMVGYPAMHLNVITGELTITPNKIGRYLVAVLCKEWRGGVVINEIRREFQCIVTDCGALANTLNVKAGINQTVLVGEKIQFHGTGGARYLWLPADFLSNPYIEDPVGYFTKPGVYTYVLSAASDDGCNGTDTITITVLEHSDFTVPTAFTPNGDGNNDVLMPMAVHSSTLKSFRVYNRWGNLMYESNTTAPGWDGTYKGNKQDMGTYMWAVTYSDNAGTERTKGGSTLLLR